MQYLDREAPRILVVVFKVSTTTTTEIADRTIVGVTTEVETTTAIVVVTAVVISMVLDKTSYVTIVTSQITSPAIVEHLGVL